MLTANSNGYHVHLPPLAEGEARGSEMEETVVLLAGTWSLPPPPGSSLHNISMLVWVEGAVTTGRS